MSSGELLRLEDKCVKLAQLASQALKSTTSRDKPNNNNNNNATAAHEIGNLHLLVETRKANREMSMVVKHARSKAQEEKQNMDRLNLHLQSLHYAKNDMVKQLHALLHPTTSGSSSSVINNDNTGNNTTSKNAAANWANIIHYHDDQDMNDGINGEDLNVQNAENPRNNHKVMMRMMLEQFSEEAEAERHGKIMRLLERELEERKKLQAHREELTQKLQGIERENQEKKAHLEQAVNELEGIAEMAQKWHDQYFNPKKARFLALSDQAGQNLCSELYIIFTKAASYLSAFNLPGLTINIVNSPTNNNNNNNNNAYYSWHPHCLELEMEISANLKAKIRFGYLEKLETIILNTQIVNHDSHQDFFNDPKMNYLGELFFENDFGVICPLPPTSQVLNVGKFEFDPVKAGGYCYKWLEGLADSRKMGILTQSTVKSTLIIDPHPNRHFGDVVDFIKNRFISLSSLQQQLDSLQKLNVMSIPNEVSNILFPFASKTKLFEWREEVEQRTQNSRTYFAAFERSKLKVEARIVIGIGYPAQPPKFHLTFLNQNYQSTNSTANNHPLQVIEASDGIDTTALTLFQTDQANNPDVIPFFDNNPKVIENEINKHYDELFVEGKTDKNDLLTLMLLKLEMCIDIYVESDRKDSLSFVVLNHKKSRANHRVNPFYYSYNQGLLHRYHSNY